jgi:hypothetical protein
MRRLIVSLTLSVLALHAESQDNHYEYMKMGSRNAVLANAGLSRFEDQAAVIVNPATLSFAKGSSFAFNTTAVGWNSINFENGLGQGFDINYGNMSVLPTTAAGVIKPKTNAKDWVLGYALYHPISDRLRFTDRQTYSVDVINEIESPGMEKYLGQANVAHDLDEVNAVLGIGFNVTDKLALGISQTFTYRSEEYSNSFTASAISTSPLATLDVVAYTTDFYTRYYRVLTRTKLGLALTQDKWDIGITLTLPSLGLFGTGQVMGQVSTTNIRPDPSKPRESQFASGQYEKQKATYKHSMALGLGVSRVFGKVRLYGAVNAYSAIDNYSIMDPGPADFIQPPTEDNIANSANFLRVWAGNQDVVNGSIAADWQYKESKRWMCSFHTDKFFSRQDELEPGRSLTLKNWDNYHFTIGHARTIGRSDWVMGIRYTHASRDDVRQPFSFDNPSEDNFLQGDRRTGKVVATSIQLMLSYAIRFMERD